MKVVAADENKRTLRERVARLESLLKALIQDKTRCVDINNLTDLEHDLLSDEEEQSDFEDQVHSRAINAPLVSILGSEQVRMILLQNNIAFTS